jgi:hypothetical protein
MESKYTKGTWFMNTTKKFIDNKGLAITDEKNRLICEVSHDLSELSLKEYEANAKLIAAAPELFESCMSLISQKDKGVRVNGELTFTAGMVNAILKIQEALKKATE